MRVGLVIRTVFAVVAAILAAAVPAQAASRKVPQGFFGVNTSGNIEIQPSSVQLAHWDKLASAGAESVRILFNWDIAQKQKGAPIDWTRNDALVTNATERGMEILPVVEYAPPWAKQYRDQVASPPKGTTAYTAFLRKAIQRYGPNGEFWKTYKLTHPLESPKPIRQWQIWNEPEIVFHWYRKPLGDKWQPEHARQYVTLLRAAYKTVHATDSGAKVVLAALSIDSWRTLDKLYRWGKLGKDFDVAALQGYAGKPSFIPTLLHRFRDVLDQHGASKVPLYVTEMTWPAAKGKAHPRYTTGYMTGFLTDQKGAAKRLETGYKILADPKLRDEVKLKRAYWYIGATSYSGHFEFDYSGLLKFTARAVSAVPAYFAYQRTARTYEGCAKDTRGKCK